VLVALAILAAGGAASAQSGPVTSKAGATARRAADSSSAIVLDFDENGSLIRRIEGAT